MNVRKDVSKLQKKSVFQTFFPALLANCNHFAEFHPLLDEKTPLPYHCLTTLIKP